MQNRKSVEYQIGFADSEIISYRSTETNLLIFLKTWNEITLKIEFVNSIFFMIYTNWGISDICEIDDPKYMENALNMVYENIPTSHPYKAFQFIDIEGDPSAEVYCTNLIISKEQS